MEKRIRELIKGDSVAEAVIAVGHECLDFLRNVFDGGTPVVFLQAPSGRIIASNRAYRQMSGYTHDELTTMLYVELAADQEAARWRGQIARYQLETRGYADTFLRKLRHKSGAILTTLTVAYKAADDFALVAERDITPYLMAKEGCGTCLREEKAGKLPWPEELSATELAVAELLKQGLTSKEVGHRLKMSLKTVHNHRGSIRRKLRLTPRDVLRVALGNFG